MTVFAGSSSLFLIYLIVVLLLIVSEWIVFKKAGRPGWAAIIPIYNAYIFLKVAGRPGWWLILWLIPFVDIVVWIIVSLDVSRKFGHGGWFAVGLILLSFIFLPILAFGDSTYNAAA
jgi:Family of unknown function (DUF5684)